VIAGQSQQHNSTFHNLPRFHNHLSRKLCPPPRPPGRNLSITSPFQARVRDTEFFWTSAWSIRLSIALHNIFVFATTSYEPLLFSIFDDFNAQQQSLRQAFPSLQVPKLIVYFETPKSVNRKASRFKT